MNQTPLLQVSGLRVVFNTRNGQQVAVDELSFSLARGQVLGIVGESGSGKSVACYALLGLIPSPPGAIEAGSALFNGADLLSMDEAQLRKLRGNKIAMIFQDPMTSLNPNMRVADQLTEVLRTHKGWTGKQAQARALQVLEEVGIRDAAQRMFDYPHQFSGGMRQRVVIAMALLADPELLIADEPTTALDVTVQAQILELLNRLKRERNLGIIFITHDLAVAASMVDKLVVMQKGKVVEAGSRDAIFNQPQAAYTQKLLASVLTEAKPQPRVVSDGEQPLVRVRHLKTWFTQRKGWFFNRQTHYVKATDDISLDIYPGEILGVVGESGSGKSTLGRSIIRLLEPTAGTVEFAGQSVLSLEATALRHLRAQVQMIFQDPYASLNPRQTIFQTLAEPLLLHGLSNKSTLTQDVLTLMDEVGLERGFINKYPHEFSGGQRQRIAIARAIAVKPKLIVADEPVSALDVTIRAQIIELLTQLSQKYSMAILFISHDMSVVRYLCDRVVVMQQGRIVEVGETEAIMQAPQQEYTRQLIRAIPNIAL